MTERPLAELVLLDSFVDREDETGYVLNEDLASPATLEAACARFPLSTPVPPVPSSAPSRRRPAVLSPAEERRPCPPEWAPLSSRPLPLPRGAAPAPR
mmetsp:Transcript_7879/g.23719  ORF Transcript_7879/g.23719 Transcript_7879/m.23719 type:complete len:98 (-) Transcript_7879:649-942(-)